MALRVAGDADLAKRLPELGERPQQRHGSVELAGRLLGVAGHHEHVARAGRAQPLDELGEVAAVPDVPGGEVRHDLVAVPGEPLRRARASARAPSAATS